MIKTIDLGRVQIPIEDLAGEGNAILGIRGAGKTYAATFFAEQLLQAKIPFIAFDPIGVWRYLRNPGRNGKGTGFKVVVAGDNGDLPLTPETAPEIVRAAMRENIPLIIDLYSMRLSKADWRRIVEQSVKILLYENGQYGLRHVFIEEAAEFVPQIVRNDQTHVYAEIEKLSRMGRNQGLGFTIINQRAEQVNKAVLENCNRLFLMRQMGRNSLKALEAWLAYANEVDPERAAAITKTLPGLTQGEAWVWSDSGNRPELVKIPEKVSLHPSGKKRAPADAKESAEDVGKFVEQLKDALGKVREKLDADDPKELRKQISSLRTALTEKAAPAKPETVEVPILSAQDKEQLNKCVIQMLALSEQMTKTIHGISHDLGALKATIEKAASNSNASQMRLPPRSAPTLKVAPPRPPHSNPDHSGNGELSGGARRMLVVLAQRGGLTKAQLGVRAGISHTGGTFGTYLGKLRSLGYVEGSAELNITEQGLAALGDWDPLPEGKELLEHYLNELGSGIARMLWALSEAYPNSMSAQELGEATSISASGGTFGTYLGKLRTLELITGGRDALRMSEELA